MSQDQKFPARLRIKSRKEIELLFENDKSFFAHPLLLKVELVKLPPEGEDLIQFAVSVPKRNYRKAHDRNLLKRRIREAYRLNWKTYLSPLPGRKILLMFILTGKEEYAFSLLEKAMKRLLTNLKSNLPKPVEDAGKDLDFDPETDGLEKRI